MAITDRKSVTSGVKYLKWQPLYENEKPFNIFIDIPEDAVDQRTNNLVFEQRDTAFEDIGERKNDFTLDDNGFCFQQHDHDFDAFEDQKLVEKEYLPEVEKLIKSRVAEADKVFIFDWRLRKSDPAAIGSVIDLAKPTDWLRPSIHAHVDQAPSAVLARTMMHLPDEAEVLLKGRVRVINYWRPLRHVVDDWPLAFCDGSTLLPDDLVETDHVRRGYAGATLNLLHRDYYRWYYFGGQSRSDVVLFKNFDSETSVKARCCPHVSFENPRADPASPNRQSLEVRALVYTFT